MLWFRKRPEAAVAAPDADQIIPTELPLPLDGALFQHHFDALLESAGQDGGIESWLAALGAKQQVYATTLGRANAQALGMDDIERLLAYVFTARRRVYPALEALGNVRVAGLVCGLLYGEAPLAQRMQDFVDAMPGAAGMDRPSVAAAAKVRRAAWDFAADLVHFSDPVRYPLMSRWVWDRTTQSGALREFVRGHETEPEIPFENSPGLFEGTRYWLGERLGEQGIYRDVPLWIDFTLAQAYVSYFRSVAEGSLGGDFGRGTRPHEQVRKLLGIDAPSKRARVKKAVMSNTGV